MTQRWICACGENGLNCVFKSGETVYAEEQDILHATVFQVVGAFRARIYWVSFAPTVILRILVSFHGNSQYNISSAAEDPAVFTDLIMNAVHENKRIYRVQRT